MRNTQAIVVHLLSFSSPDLRLRHGLRTYELERSCCYDSLLLDEERGRLFVGGKNYLASLSLDNISKQDKKVAWLRLPGASHQK